jgi:hypothetical protein
MRQRSVVQQLAPESERTGFAVSTGFRNAPTSYRVSRKHPVIELAAAPSSRALDAVGKDDDLVDAPIPVIRAQVLYTLNSHFDPGLIGKVNDDQSVAIGRAGCQETPNCANARIVAMLGRTTFDSIDPALEPTDERRPIPSRLTFFGTDQVHGRGNLLSEPEIADTDRAIAGYGNRLPGSKCFSRQAEPKGREKRQRLLDRSNHFPATSQR